MTYFFKFVFSKSRLRKNHKKMQIKFIARRTVSIAALHKDGMYLPTVWQEILGSSNFSMFAIFLATRKNKFSL